jgi:hypothetical protein
VQQNPLIEAFRREEAQVSQQSNTTACIAATLGVELTQIVVFANIWCGPSDQSIRLSVRPYVCSSVRPSVCLVSIGFAEELRIPLAREMFLRRGD